MHLIIVTSPMGEQMVKIIINDQTGKSDFPSAAHLWKYVRTVSETSQQSLYTTLPLAVNRRYEFI